MAADVRVVGDLVLQVQSVFLETPRLRLTPVQAQSRFGLDRPTCTAILEALADANVLEKRNDGAYTRFYPRTIDRFSARAIPFVHAA